MSIKSNSMTTKRKTNANEWIKMKTSKRTGEKILLLVLPLIKDIPFP
jgi:hypothetical protein